MKTRGRKTGKKAPSTDIQFWSLQLYISGKTEPSAAALNNLAKICETHGAGKNKVEVIDVLKNPRLAAGDQIVAVPTLVRRLPPPLKRRMGDRASSERVIVGLDMQPAENMP